MNWANESQLKQCSFLKWIQHKWEFQPKKKEYSNNLHIPNVIPSPCSIFHMPQCVQSPFPTTTSVNKSTSHPPTAQGFLQMQPISTQQRIVKGHTSCLSFKWGMQPTSLLSCQCGFMTLSQERWLAHQFHTTVCQLKWVTPNLPKSALSKAASSVRLACTSEL